MMTVQAFPLKHRYEAPVTGFLFAEKEKERNKKLQKIKELEALDNKNLKNPTNSNPDETAFINSFLPKLGGKN